MNFTCECCDLTPSFVFDDDDESLTTECNRINILEMLKNFYNNLKVSRAFKTIISGKPVMYAFLHGLLKFNTNNNVFRQMSNFLEHLYGEGLN